MPGKLCNGSDDMGLIKESRAYCEGRAARAASATPTNPHESGSDAADAWDAGVASKVSAPDDHACCAPTGAAAV